MPAALSENHRLTQHGQVNTKIQRVWVIGSGGVNPQEKMTNRNKKSSSNLTSDFLKIYN